MNSFIVMQGETYQEEHNAGVLWTPQIDKSGMVPHSWNRMQELKKGDIVFHYVKGFFVAISRVRKDCQKGIKPKAADEQQPENEEAYIARTEYRELENPLSVKEFFRDIQPLLPVKYAAFQEDASGNSGYLYPCNEELAMKLLELVSSLNIFTLEEEQLELAMEVIKKTEHNPLLGLIAEAELEIKTKMRRGKEQFRESLLPLWNGECPLCGIAIGDVLKASHAKPWKDSSDAERLDPFNGILLCANHAALYSAGLIAFTGGGRLHISSRIPEKDYPVYGLRKNRKVPVLPEHAPYLRWHKRIVFAEPRKVKLLTNQE
ncbi:HNH endonuclease signature motif containing protein [Planococcus sp. ISL-110]|uniref:HNH endonuclease n=1 Tax=Planococcus sp. ISL-110 TaxID=2819167 RepID=UPI001BE6797A|nr:HNH endonuclease signature motif containing protein [Planococcus sp. ISL-110]MBT2570832.1 HNH endonuclease [Planococcus sp. ISL-110]